MHELPDLPAATQRDQLIGYMDRLLREAGEIPAHAGAGAAAHVGVHAIGASGGAVDTVSPEIAATLTERERNLLHHVARGMSNKDLANRLSVSTNTVKWHLRNIFEKLRISNRVQAIAVARHLGLID
jgi:LuxR family maltose regulon positive regulatory protein